MLLRAENLSRRFGGVSALEGVDLELARGAVHAVIGPNGAGKTTLLNVLSGVYRAHSGRIRLEGEDLASRPPHAFAAAGIGRTFQNLQVFFNMSALENVMAGRWLRERCGLAATLLRTRALARAERACRETAERLLAEVGLERWIGARADAMPYGALKRLEIARALAAEPKLLLLDEPAAGLNPSETKGIDELIRRIAARGITVVLVEHNMKLVMEVSSHVVVLDYGRKLAEGDPGSVSADPRVIRAYLGAAAA
ncbi:MAG: ABC transporter ATP-binding protein [Clostridia bacterium]